MARLAVERNEGVINSTGSLSVNTGKYTGRSPDDRFIVYDDKTNDTIDWGKINHQFPSDKFEKLLEKMKSLDRKSTRLNSSHKPISYADFCLKKKI